jgi:3-oxoacyl-[acyl-carrier protein] reductase
LNTERGALHGRAALVTGGTRGIGRAIALALAGAGAHVAVGYRERSDAAAATVGEIEALGVRALAIPGDVARREDVRALIAGTRQRLGAVHILVNNAGVLQQKPFAEITDADWDHVLDVNLKAVFMCAQEVLPVMATQGGGRIINLASSGVISLTRSLARIAAPSIIVNCIAAGLIDTEMTQSELASPQGHQKLAQIPLGRPGLPEDVAAAALFLASSSSYMTGQTINVNGGLYFG